MKKHTPGSWTPAVYKVTSTMVKRMKIGSIHHAVCTNHKDADPTELLVAICGDERGLDSQSAADALLIASSPDLLAFAHAIEARTTACIKMGTFPTINDLFEWNDFAKNLIARATRGPE